MSEALESVYPEDACRSSVSEITQGGHLPGGPNENVFDEDVRESDMGMNGAMMSVGITRPSDCFTVVRTTINSPEILEIDKKKYNSGGGCDCDTCKTKKMQEAQQLKRAHANAPIMITPYRHNWIISGQHRGKEAQEEVWNLRECCIMQ